MRAAHLNPECVDPVHFWNSPASLPPRSMSLVQIGEKLTFAACLVYGTQRGT